MTRTDAEKAVRERTEDECQHYEHFNSREGRYICPGKVLTPSDEVIQAAYRKQIGETGRSVPQYPDQAGGE